MLILRTKRIANQEPLLGGTGGVCLHRFTGTEPIQGKWENYRPIVPSPLGDPTT